MIETWHHLASALLPWDWAHYAFMRSALLAVLLAAPVFALAGTMVVNNRMAFFSEVLGHSALTGVAIGVVLGAADPFWPMLAFAVLLAFAFNVLRHATRASADTVLGVFLAFAVALGVVILSRGGGFARYTTYLIGDILAVGPAQLEALALLLAVVLGFWLVFANALVLTGVSPVLGRSRGLKVVLLETAFTVLLAVTVAVSIRLVGLLIINALLVLPAAAARNIASDMRGYTFGAVAISLVCGVAGLIVSYYAGTASGATIVLFAAGCYILTALAGRARG